MGGGEGCLNTQNFFIIIAQSPFSFLQSSNSEEDTAEPTLDIFKESLFMIMLYLHVYFTTVNVEYIIFIYIYRDPYLI